MPPNLLRIIAFSSYLAAWLAFAIGAAIGAIPALRRQAAASTGITAPVAIGALLQVASAMVLTMAMTSGPLRPPPLYLGTVIALAPISAALFLWSLRSAPSNATPDTLVTSGAYRFLRHPIYLAFLAMLLATGLLVSTTPKLVFAVVIYLAGTEMRIAEEERELAGRHGDAFDEYCRQTRWRYLPGLR